MIAGDPRERLHAWLHEKGNAHLADAVENASLTITGGDLNVVAPKSYALYFKDRGFEEAVREVFGRPLRIKLTHGRSRRGPGADQHAPRRLRPTRRTKPPAARLPTRKCSVSAKSSAAKYAKFATSRSRHVKLPGNMQQMMRQAQQMQEKMQQDIALIKVTATAGGGMVTVTDGRPEEPARASRSTRKWRAMWRCCRT